MGKSSDAAIIPFYKKNYFKHALYIIFSIIYLYIWHYVAHNKILGNSLVTPWETVEHILKLCRMKLAGHNLLGHILISLGRITSGWLLALVVGIPIGYLMALSRRANIIIKPIFDLFKPMPPIAWISVAILWLGIGETSKVFIIFIGAIIPCVLNAYNGIRLVDPELYDVVRMFGGSRKDEILKVALPYTLPSIFAGIHISWNFSWMTLLAAEMVCSREGIGFIILMGMTRSRMGYVLAGMVIIAVIACLTSYLLTLAEKYTCPWRSGIE